MKYFLTLLTLTFVCGFLRAQSDSLVLPLWKNGAPCFENRKDEPEEAKDYWVKNINNPSITVYFPPRELANGTPVLICPGGGFRLLVFTAEGRDPAKFLNKVGITAIILKYRLPAKKIHLIRSTGSRRRMHTVRCVWCAVTRKNGK